MIIIKTKKDIDFIRESCRIVAETLRLLKSKVVPGITTLELDLIAEDYIKSNNAFPAFKGYSQGGAPGFPGSVCCSIDDAVVHRHAVRLSIFSDRGKNSVFRAIQ